MSTSKGSTTRKRPQKHQNRTTFKNDLHDTSQKTKFLNKLEIFGVCTRCKDILDWKIKYKKYKPLTAPRKCVGCDQKTVKYAYHMLCSKCAKEKNVCAKCCKPIENEEAVEEHENAELKTMLKGLPERKRRTILRFINKQQDGQQKISPEIFSQIEDLLSKIDNVKLDDNDDNEDEYEDDSLIEKDNIL